jgi:WD40 repeat protein
MENNQHRGIAKITETTPQYLRGKNFFLGIGINAYSKPYSPLRNCVNDIRQVSTALLDAYDFEAENIFTLFDKEASRKAILKKLRDVLDKVGENDSLIFMYSGHGENLDGSNVGFMIPADASDEEDFINLSDIKSRLDAAKAKHIFVIFDACFSGLLLTQRDARAQNLPENFPSRYAMTSGRNHPVDDGSGEHSPFAKALIDELRDNDDSLGAVMLAQRILDRFRQTGKDDDQLPAFGRISSDIEFEGQYYFYPKNYELSAARERTKRLEAEQARRMAEEALINVERERKRAEKLARAASNTATFMQMRDQSPTFALRMMHYNLLRHPDSSISHAMFYKALMDKSVFINRLLRGHSGMIQSICFAKDQSFLVTGDRIGVVKIWDFRTGTCLQTFENKEVGINAMALSDDKKWLITGDDQSTVHVWSLETNSRKQTIKTEKNGCGALALSADSKWLAVGYFDRDIAIYNMADGKCLHILRGGENGLMKLLFYENDKHLASLDQMGMLKLWSVETGKCLKTVDESSKNHSHVNISDDAELIVVCAEDGRARVRKLATDERLWSFGSSEKPIFNAYFSKDRTLLITNDYETIIKIWSLETGELLKACRSENGICESLAISADKNWLALGHQDFNLSLWCLKDDLSQKTWVSETRYPTALAIAKDQNHFVVSYQEPPSVSLWSITDGLVKTYGKPEMQIIYAGFTPDNQYVVSSDMAGVLFIHDFKTGKLHKKLKDLGDGVSALCFTRDGEECVITKSTSTSIELMAFPSGKALKTFEGHERAVSCLVLTTDDKYMASGGYDGWVLLWSIETGALLHKFVEFGASVHSVAFSPDGRYIAAGLSDYKTVLFDTTAGKRVREFIGHQNTVSSVAFTADGQFLLTSSGDKTIKLWSVETGTPLKTFVGHKDALTTAVLLADNQRFISIDELGFIKLWSLADAVEENMMSFPLHEFAEWQFQIEPEDTPQYLDELLAAIDGTSFTKEDAAYRIETHIKDPDLKAAALKRLSLKK